jgi:DNA-binding GntR family transcriptional regulator
VWDEHEAIAKAIATGDARRAAALIDEHGEHAGHNLAQQLQQVLSPGA